VHYKDKVVWITGASSGLGEALAYEFSKAEARLIISGRNTEELNKLKNNLKRSERDILIYYKPIPFQEKRLRQLIISVVSII
jgi:NADP-dependent 3-hydroxy acid dehydrogenase YdfG